MSTNNGIQILSRSSLLIIPGLQWRVRIHVMRATILHFRALYQINVKCDHVRCISHHRWCRYLTIVSTAIITLRRLQTLYVLISSLLLYIIVIQNPIKCFLECVGFYLNDDNIASCLVLRFAGIIIGTHTGYCLYRLHITAL